jgi:hypothetical protein
VEPEGEEVTKLTAEELAVFLEGCKWPARSEGDLKFAEGAALVRSLERIRLAAECIDGNDETIDGVEVVSISPRLFTDLIFALDAHRTEFGE